MRAPLIVLSIFLGLVAQGGQSAEQTRPSFRAGIAIVEIDAVVTSGRSTPVTDLALEDFEVRDQGQRVELHSVEFVGYRSQSRPVEASPAIPSATASRQPSEGRVVVIVYDDLYDSVPLTAGLFQRAKTIGNAIVDSLGPDDEAAVVGVSGGGKYQTRLTRDKSLLRASFDRPALYGGPTDANSDVLSTLQSVAETLETIPHRRKLIFLIAKEGVNFSESMRVGSEGDARIAKIRELQISAARSRTVLYAVSSREPGSLSSMIRQESVDSAASARRTYSNALGDMRTLAEATGGRAVADTNFLAEGVSRIFAENVGYYVLRFQAQQSEKTEFRKVEVKVKRRGLQVRARPGYWAGPMQ